MEIYDYTVEKEESGIRIGPLSCRKRQRSFQVVHSETSERWTDYSWG